ncbi:uncharacterized protein LOC107639952 [Arachis ipaensis]|uniref:uncharacterized protein LOC107639952 n=1 Tax=Arachis ipaensis TaxID=130454 RepID=UPI0007AF07D9|nr:uncharacterized protein LOC107639952 [Arachis ipaensis]
MWCLHNFPESLLHVLRDCEVARRTWMGIDNSLVIGNFFNTPLLIWLLDNLSPNTPSKGRAWPLLFATTMNMVWYRRNKVIFYAAEVLEEGKLASLAIHLASDVQHAYITVDNVKKKVDTFIDNLHIEVDSLAAVKLCSHKGIECHSLKAIVLAIKDRCDKLCNWNLNHQYREANSCADGFANFGHSLMIDCHVFFTLPSCISLCFHSDAIGTKDGNRSP